MVPSRSEWSDWLTVEFSRGAAAGSWGWYSGSIVDGHSQLVASLAQEMVCRDQA
ncbi:hypothetical protein [Rhodococcus aetherivorans]|uniref:hypothetical protein n=1 Tax=Rhodococcus aetherivorans TaxID=191292 RepID=UPI00365D0C39